MMRRSSGGVVSSKALEGMIHNYHQLLPKSFSIDFRLGPPPSLFYHSKTPQNSLLNEIDSCLN
jgi:hypothetical protein